MVETEEEGDFGQEVEPDETAVDDPDTQPADAPNADASVEELLAQLKVSKKKKKKKTKAVDEEEEEEGGNAAEKPKNANEYSYKVLLDRMYDQLIENNPDLINKKRAAMKPPEVLRVGTSKILWANFPEICATMKRDPEHVMRFFLAELGTTGSKDGNGRFMIKGKFVPKYIESLLKKYISEYVTCPMCKGVQTRLERDNASRMYFLHCSSCGATKTVTAIKQGYHAAQKGERKAARATAGP